MSVFFLFCFLRILAFVCLLCVFSFTVFRMVFYDWVHSTTAACWVNQRECSSVQQVGKQTDQQSRKKQVSVNLDPSPVKCVGWLVGRGYGSVDSNLLKSFHLFRYIEWQRTKIMESIKDLLFRWIEKFFLLRFLFYKPISERKPRGKHKYWIKKKKTNKKVKRIKKGAYYTIKIIKKKKDKHNLVSSLS